MEIQAVNYVNYLNVKRFNIASKPNKNYVSFEGWFNKKKSSENDEFIRKKESGSLNSEAINKDSFTDFLQKKDLSMMSSHDVILSCKLADVLHRVDSESIAVVGDPKSLFFKNFVKRVLTDEDSFIDNPKNIKDVYVINEKTTNPLIISKNNEKKNSFKVYGLAKNLNKTDKDFTTYKNIVEFGDIIETQDKVKIKFIKTGKESNNLFYDENVPVRCILEEGEFINSKPVRSVENLSEANNKDDISKLREKINLNNDNNVSSIPLRTFDDVAGMDETVNLVKKKILFPLLYPDAFKKQANKGVIFYGEPGTGKTLLALAIIGEAKKRQNKDIYFVKIDSQEFERSSFGESEKLWRETFKKLVENQPAILFIDELDAIVPQRREGSNYVGKNGVVAQLLTLIDGLEKQNARVSIIATTNRPDMIDRAIKRNGRLGNLIEIKKPDEKGCLDILNHYLKNKSVNDNFDREEFAKKLHDLSCTGADINVIVENAMDKMYERYGIYKKMDDGTYKESDLDNLQYENEDFEKSLEDMKNRK